MRPPERILLIEDDRDIAGIVSSNLRDEGYRVEEIDQAMLEWRHFLCFL